jgi:hypothetical protein
MEEGDWMRRTHICNLFLPAVHDSLLDQNLNFFTDEAWFHLMGYINTRNNGYGSNVNLSQILKYPIMIRRLVCGVPSLLHE